MEFLEFCNSEWGSWLPEALQRTYYFCVIDLKKKNLFSDQETLIDKDNIIENHAGGKTNDDVQALSIKNGLVAFEPIVEPSFVPTFLPEIFKNLTALEINLCKVKTISKEDLKHFGNLKSLWLRNNKLSSLSKDLFKYTRKLEIISFQKNKIEFIGSHLLTPLQNLLYVDFRDNVNIDVCYLKKPNIESIPEIGNLVTLEVLKQKISSDCQCVKDKAGPLVAAVRELWESGRFSDFTIKVHKVEFKVHKCILGVNSPVFEAMFDHEMQEQIRNELEIVDLSSDAIKEFLEFIYTRKTPSSSVNAMDLFAAAAKYQVDSFKEIAETLVLDALNTQNAYDVFTLGRLFDNDFIQVSAFSSILSIFPNESLPEELIHHPEKLKKMIDTKSETDEAIESARLKMEAVLDVMKGVK